jgi:two-component system sensor histidine kinase PilS (NtrC family)
MTAPAQGLPGPVDSTRGFDEAESSAPSRGSSWFREAPEPAARDRAAAAAPGLSAAGGLWLNPLWWGSLSAGPSANGSASAAGSALGRSLWRIFRTYLVARAAVGLLLAAMQFLNPAAGASPKMAALLISGLYALEACALAGWLWGRGRVGSGVRLSPRAWIVLTIGADLVAFIMLLGNESAAGLNHGALLVLPVLMAGVLMSRPGALATAGGVAVVLLFDAWSQSLKSPAAPPPWLGSVLAGMGLLAMAWLAGELSSRLRREERAAVDSQQKARQQAGLNQLVIQEMSEGLLVVDRYRRVLAVNPSAQALLGLPAEVQTPNGHLQGPSPSWAPLLRAVERAHAEGSWPAVGRVVSWPDGAQGAAGPTKLRVRLRFTRQIAAPGMPGPEDPEQDLCVLLIEDERVVQVRVQQEKLAAMGRVSAGIAHEIRNPLAAIAQANELLSEGRLGRSQQRLVSIISDNVVRLRRLVDDVLESMPTGVGQAGSMNVVDLVRTVVEEWRGTVGVAPGVVDLNLRTQQAQAWFDPEHLRRILVNLLDNAYRYSSRDARAVTVTLDLGVGDGVVLMVSNDGPPISADVEMHLFEPFFSTRSRGSGLGLYLCKELCERHGANIRHVRLDPGQRHATAFVVLLPGLSAASSGWGSL